jgi:hypothetical protein
VLSVTAADKAGNVSKTTQVTVKSKSTKINNTLQIPIKKLDIFLFEILIRGGFEINQSQYTNNKNIVREMVKGKFFHHF